VHLTQRPGPSVLAADDPVGPQSGQPVPAEVADLLEVLQAGIPVIEQDVSRGEAPAPGHQEHLPEVVVLGLAVGLAEEAVIAGDPPVTVAPEQGDQVDPADDLLLLARPVAGDQADVPGAALVQGRVIDDEGSAPLLD